MGRHSTEDVEDEEFREGFTFTLNTGVILMEAEADNGATIADIPGPSRQILDGLMIDELKHCSWYFQVLKRRCPDDRVPDVRTLRCLERLVIVSRFCEDYFRSRLRAEPEAPIPNVAVAIIEKRFPRSKGHVPPPILDDIQVPSAKAPLGQSVSRGYHSSGRRSVFTRKRILEAVQTFVQRMGRRPGMEDLDEVLAGLRYGMVYRLFGGLDALLEETNSRGEKV